MVAEVTLAFVVALALEVTVLLEEFLRPRASTLELIAHLTSLSTTSPVISAMTLPLASTIVT